MSKDDKDKQHGGNFVNGFMWGAIVGGGVSWIATHKKGRELVVDISENGIEALRGILHPENIQQFKDELRMRVNKDNFEKQARGYYEHEERPRIVPRKRIFKGVKKKG